MNNSLQFQRDTAEDISPSFFQNSQRLGNISVAEKPTDQVGEPMNDLDRRVESKRRKVGGGGGFTCCVPHCFSNNKRDRHLKFYEFPSGGSKEKQLLRKKWLHCISRKDFKPTSAHRVCSLHFPEGKKTYLNNIPSITPKTESRKPVKERATFKARNRVFEAKSGNSDENVDPKKNTEDIEQYANHNHAKIEDESNTCNFHVDLEAQIKLLKEENTKLKAERDAEKKINVTLHKMLGVAKENNFSVESIKNDPKLCRFYIGLPDYATFYALFKSFDSVVHNLIYYGSTTNAEKISSSDYVKHGPKRSLTPEQEFFLVLVRLRLGLLEEDLAHRAGITQSTMSKICITWIDFLHSRLRLFPIWPTRQCIDKTMPLCFKEMYPKTRVIIDCTEFFMEKASSVRSQSVTYSSYKHYNTAKALIGITPAGAVSFASDLYAGRTSDRQATNDCGILDLLEEGDSIMADKGFNIKEDLPKGVDLNIPPFLRGKEYLDLQEEQETRKIASVRIHVEHAISRIKTFRILNMVFPITMAAELNKILVICAYLTNFLPPLIVDKD